MDSSMVSQRAGPPAGKLDPYSDPRKPRRRTSHLSVGLVTISKRWLWQVIVVIVPLVASGAANKEGHWAASYQTLLSTRPSSPAPLSFQNSTKRWNTTSQDLSNASTKGHPPWHAMERYLYNSSTNLPTQADFVSNYYRKNEASYLTSTTSETLGASPQDSMSPVGTAPGTTDAKMTGLLSSRGAPSYPASMLHHSTDVLSGSPPTQPSDSSSRKAHSEQMTLHTGQELSIPEPADRVPPTSAAPITLLRVSVRSSSHHSGEVASHLTLPALRDFTGSAVSRGLPTQHHVEPLRTSLFRSVPAPTTMETRNTSAVPTPAVGTQLDAKHYTYTEVLLSSVFRYGEIKYSIPTGQDLSSAMAWINSSNQPSTAESIIQWSQKSNTTYDYPPRNADLPVMSHSPEAESFPTISSLTQLAIEIPTHIPHSSEAGMPESSLSLATTQLDPDTVAVGMPTEANLSLGRQSSQPRDDLRSQTLTTLPPSLGTSKADEVSSLAIEDTGSTYVAERTKLEWKDITSHRGEERAELHVSPTHDAISKDINGTIHHGTDSIDWQPSTAISLDLVNSGCTGTKYNIPLLQDDSSEAGTNTPSLWDLVKMGRSATTAVVSPVFSTELPLTTADNTPTLGLTSSLISGQPKAELAGQRYTLSQRWSEMQPFPPNSTSLATPRVVLTFEESSELEAPTVSSATKKVSSAVVHMVSEETGATLASRPYLGTSGVTSPIGPTSPGMAHPNLHTGGFTASPAMELFSVRSPEQKDDVPMPSHVTASLANATEMERISVVATPRSVPISFTSLDSFRTSVSELTLEMHVGATEKAEKEEEVPEVTMLSGLSSAEVWQSGSKTVASSPTSASPLYRTEPPLLPTEDLEVNMLDTSAVTTTLGTERRYQSDDASAAIGPLDDGITTLHTLNPGSTDSSGSKPPLSLSISEIASAPNLPESSVPAALLTTSRLLPDESKLTCSNASCLMRTFPSSVTPFPAQLFTTSQPLLTRKVLGSTLGPADVGRNRSTVGVGARAASPKEISAKTVAGAEKVTVIPGGHSSKQPESKSKGPVPSESTTKENLTALSIPTLPVPAVHILPLWFRLIGIDYMESLENKSSETYKKLEKEVKLTVNKMLSTYESFLQTNILRFLNGSVIVKAEAVFQRRVPIPTPSDILRTIVTEVERRAMDTFFDWRLDVQSLRSSGFTLSNLEPEKLDVSFTVLELASSGALGAMMTGNHLESLRNKVALLLGVRYTVRNVSLVESGNIQGGIDINGEVYVDTDTRTDIGWALEALMGLSNDSVDLTSLSINGARLSLQVFPVSFLVTNRIFNEKMMDRSSAERQNLVRDLSDVLMRVLGKYKNLLQVTIRKITGGSLVCHGDVIFQHPAPTSKDVLQTLALAVGPRDYLDSSTLQVDPLSFTVAGDGLVPPFANLGVPSYAVIVTALFILTLIAIPILVLLPKMLGRKDKIIINSSRDLEAGIEMFQLDNPAFRPTVEEVHSDCLNANVCMLKLPNSIQDSVSKQIPRIYEEDVLELVRMTTDLCTFRQPQSVSSTKAFGEGGMMPHSI